MQASDGRPRQLARPVILTKVRIQGGKRNRWSQPVLDTINESIAAKPALEQPGPFSTKLRPAYFATPTCSALIPSNMCKSAVVRHHALALFSREGGSPVWIPAFAGRHVLLTRKGQPPPCSEASAPRTQWSTSAERRMLTKPRMTRLGNHPRALPNVHLFPDYLSFPTCSKRTKRIHGV